MRLRRRSRRSTARLEPLADRDLPPSRSARAVVQRPRLADQPHPSGADGAQRRRADRCGIRPRNRPQDLLRSQGEQGACPRRRGAAARARGRPRRRARARAGAGARRRAARSRRCPRRSSRSSLLGLCAATGTTVVIDNEDELQRLAELVESSPGAVPIAIRLAPDPGRECDCRPGSGSASTRRWRWSTGTGRRRRYPDPDRRRALPSRRLRPRGPGRRDRGEPRAGRRAARARPPRPAFSTSAGAYR